MSHVRIRPLAAADLPVAVAMIGALAEHHGDVPRVTADTLARDALGPAPWIHLVLAEIDGQVAGYMALKRLAWLHYGDRGLEIYHLYVLPERRGHGVGKALIAHAVSEALQLGCVEVKVGTHPGNAGAGQYYLSQGFVAQQTGGERFRLVL
jgi:GNAT superfamily N-acetyltransferase